MQARWGGSGGNYGISQRVIAALPYLMPLLDGLRYSKFFWKVAPQMQLILVPLEPLVRLFYSVPFSSFILFLCIYQFIVQNQNMPRCVIVYGLGGGGRAWRLQTTVYTLYNYPCCPMCINKHRRFVRFNAMQAVMLDICLIFPSLVEMLFGRPTSGAMLSAYITFYNTIWLIVLVFVAYGIGSALTGQWGRLPFLADAADAQVR